MSHMNTAYQKDCYLTDELFERENETSPDFLDFKNLQNIPVFVYDDCMVGYKNHKLLKDSVYLGESWTSTQSFVMERSDIDSPVVFHYNGPGVSTKRVYGEVFLLTPKQLLSLDFHMANNELYKREKRFVCLLEQKIKDNVRMKPSLKCWMYLGNPDFWEDRQTVRMSPKETNNQSVWMWTRSTFEDEIPNFLKSRG